MARAAFIAWTVCCIAGIASAATPIERTTVWSAAEGAYKVYRIPAIVMTKSGALLAFCEGRRNSASDTGEINLLLKRSTDNGKSFGDSQVVWADGANTCGNPCPVIDQSNGTIWLLMTHNPGPAGEKEITAGNTKSSRTVWITSSRDDGVTWEKPREITADVKKPQWSWYATGPGIGIQLKTGRLVIPCDHVVQATGKGNSHIIYSDDHGQTWKIGGEPSREEFNESQCVELSDGRLMLNMRNHALAVKAGAPKLRGVAISSDGGETFTDLRRDESLIEPICQASILRIGERILFCNPVSQEKRVAMTVRASRDEGTTWPNSVVIHNGPAAYSCLVALPDGSIGLLYECGEKTPYERIELARFRMNSIPDDFPMFIVPGREKEMELVRALFWLHYKPAGPLIPLWDEWMPMSTLWPARGGDKRDAMRGKWAAALASRPMTDEGYIHTLQHDGPAHAHGWPFPGWHVAGGVGWHFRGTGVAGYDLPTVGAEHWDLKGGKLGEINDKGLVFDLTEPRAIVNRPGFTIAAKNSPWLRLNWWASGLENVKCYVEWTTTDRPEFSSDRRAYFAPASGEAETRTMIPVSRIPGWAGTITQFRIGFDNPGPAKVIIKSFHTSPDTRHNINNSNFIRGCHDYFMWTRDDSFLRAQMPRLRTAMQCIMREFQTREKKCVYTTWPGHEGRSGVRYVDGKKQVIPGEGIGSNYWDLLPFGGEDALATIYYYDALLDLAELEELANSPGRKLGVAPPDSEPFDPSDLRSHARQVRDYGQKRFWNEQTGRFGTVDLDGQMHDYGFTFLNNEAVHYDFASPEQAKSIHAWMSGQRTVEGDTSSSADIYHWRFGPRSTTKRNLDYYFWGWSNPESIPWGYQVQDGGAVLGFSFHDLMARLKTAGPDDAASRLREIAKWFDETQAEGGYRAYYGKDSKRGTMQGANVAGGLGLDKEFFESILVPQVMLYGFLGFRPTAEGFAIDPKLPSDWPKLTITRIHLHQHVLDITVSADKTITVQGGDDSLVTTAPKGWKVTGVAAGSVKIPPN